MAEVFLAAKGQLTPQSRRELRKAGVVVVEVDDPSQCQFVRATETVSADDMLWAAMDALRHGDQYGNKGVMQREQFAINVWNLVTAARSARLAASDQ